MFRFPALKIVKKGQMMEWVEDYDKPEPGHRKLCRPEKETEIKNRCCMVVYVSMQQRFCAGDI